jgi:hypothetical protein
MSGIGEGAGDKPMEMDEFTEAKIRRIVETLEACEDMARDPFLVHLVIITILAGLVQKGVFTQEEETALLHSVHDNYVKYEQVKKKLNPKRRWWQVWKH